MLNTWDRYRLLQEIADSKNRIKALLDAGPMILFVRHKDTGDVFGADEPSRVAFARMKVPDDDAPEGWDDQANFMATNLCKMLNGEEGTDTVFGKKDLDKLDANLARSAAVVETSFANETVPRRVPLPTGYAVVIYNSDRLPEPLPKGRAADGRGRSNRTRMA